VYQQITGGEFGINSSNQQVNFKNVSFKNCQTAFLATGGFTNLIQGATFDTCGLGVDISRGGLASLVLLDSKSINSGPVIKFHDSSSDSGPRNNQIVIENLSHDNSNPIAIDSDGNEKLKATANIGTWVWGNVEPGNAEPGAYQSGTAYSTQRPTSLLSDGKYFTKAQPTYNGYTTDQFVNVKSVPGYPVKGDGSTDDSASLNAILLENANSCKIT
jgi:glucan 1,3-beta-glucosidase